MVLRKDYLERDCRPSMYPILKSGMAKGDWRIMGGWGASSMAVTVAVEPELSPYLQVPIIIRCIEIIANELY